MQINNKQEITIQELEKKALEIRKDLLKLCSIQTIHIGGDLSIADVMTVLWQYQMNYDPQKYNEENRDRFVLSKGHASAVTYFNQSAIGCFDKEDIYKEYATDMGRFSMHSCNLVNPYVEVSTGSLGHGMPVACGMAAALHLKQNFRSRVYTILGDGELSEGSIWEAMSNAVHYKLGNLVTIIDHNGLEADGTIDEITGLGNIADKFKAFGWKVESFDGNNIALIKQKFDELPLADSDTPIVFICNTIKGKGIKFMENQVHWHAGKISSSQYDDCVRELTSAYSKRWRNSNEKYGT